MDVAGILRPLVAPTPGSDRLPGEAIPQADIVDAGLAAPGPVMGRRTG